MITALTLLGYDATSLAHLYLGSFSHSSLQIPSSSVSLDGESHCKDILVLSRDVRSGSCPGFGSATQGLVPKPLLRCLGCVLRVVVLLEGEPSPKSEVLSTLEQVFIKDLYLLCSIHLSPRSGLVSQSLPPKIIPTA